MLLPQAERFLHFKKRDFTFFLKWRAKNRKKSLAKAWSAVPRDEFTYFA